MAQSDKKSRVSVFYFCGIFFCFFVFPVFLINSSLTGLLHLRLENHRHNVFEKLSGNLQKLVPFNDERKYFHLLFRRVFNFAQESSDFEQYLSLAIDRLKQNHPGRLEFVVWNKDGRIIEELTDEKRYRFVLRKLWEAFSIVRERIMIDDSFQVGSIEELKSTLNLARHFLGRVFIPETLKIPYSEGDEAAVVLADYGQTRPYFWYHTGTRGGLLCFLSWDAIKDNRGLKQIVDSLNHSSSNTVTGFASLHDLTAPYPEHLGSVKNEVILSLAKYEQSSEEFSDNRNSLVAVSAISRHTRVFSFSLKEGEIFQPDFVRIRTLLRIILLYLLFIALGYFQFSIRRSFFSIRWKLMILFLFANLAPLLILGTIAYDYLQNKYIAVANDVSLDSARMLRDVDSRYSEQVETFTRALNEIFEEFNRQHSGRDIDQQSLNALLAGIRAYIPSELFILDSNGEVALAVDDSGKSIGGSGAYVKAIGSAILRYHNGVIIPYDKNNLLSKAESPEESDFIRNSVRDSRKLESFNIGDEIKLSYWNLLGDRENYANSHFVMILWRMAKLQSHYIEEYLPGILQKSGKKKIFVKVKGKQGVFPEFARSNEIEQALKKSIRAGNAISGKLQIDAKTYLYTALPGKNMSEVALIALYPESELVSRIGRLRLSFIFAACLIVILTMIVSLAFASQFLKPIQQLGIAAAAVAGQDFKHRLEIRDQDEFGHLGQVMNNMIEGLGELEIARVVQDSLLPEVMPKLSQFSIYGKSHVMTALGGDYFDFVDIDQEHLGIIIGDVSGHGISAALIMAMAKAGVRLACDSKVMQPSDLIYVVHKIIFSIKNKKLKRMMTMQFLIINKRTGVIRFSNGGHCYPLLINHKAKTCRYVEQNGVPLGISKRPVYLNDEFSLLPGESLILYTDGIPESQNDKGEMLGYEGMADMILKNFAEDSRAFYDKILFAYMDFAGSINDDMTILVINREDRRDE